MKSKRELATDVWRAMAEFTFANFQRSDHVRYLRELGLTPGHLKALAVLDPEEPRPMRALADALSCDASQVTWLVDRLEERGLVERRALANDRRVKTVALTQVGVQTRARLQAMYYEPPEDLLTLDVEALEALRTGLSVLPRRPLWSPATPETRSAVV
jgi:MarR family transcriptional regulator, organic hydroperoxide resistance regulator